MGDAPQAGGLVQGQRVLTPLLLEPPAPQQHGPPWPPVVHRPKECAPGTYQGVDPENGLALVRLDWPPNDTWRFQVEDLRPITGK